MIMPADNDTYALEKIEFYDGKKLYKIVKVFCFQSYDFFDERYINIFYPIISQGGFIARRNADNIIMIGSKLECAEEKFRICGA